MQLSAASLYEYHRPSKCALRVFLKAQGEPEDQPGPYEDVIRKLGRRHEGKHVATFTPLLDLREGSLEERAMRTREAVEAKAGPLYQPVLKGQADAAGTSCSLVGIPDLIFPTADGDVIRDCKISRHVAEENHPEILRQMAFYALLYRQTFGAPPGRLEVLTGTGDLVEIPPLGEPLLMEDMETIVRARQWEEEPYAPIGWTYCGDCCFNTRCWSRARERQDPSLIGPVDRNLAIQFHQDGVNSVSDLLARFKEDDLAQYKRPWGTRMQRVGARSEAILRSARAMAEGRHIVVQKPSVPEAANFVMFDFEGLPPQLDDLDKVYLWGMQVMGQQLGEYHGVTAGFGEDGDRDGWFRFLEVANRILEQDPSIRFVHYADYEKTKIRQYVQRYGDDERATAGRVQAQLLDLYPIIRDSVALPAPSYSLKVVERYVGFQRTQTEFGGDWSMAKYIEATEMEDEAGREAVLDQIRTYNREDLEATWAVLQWVRSLT